jgi:hypothetical protein
MAFFYTKKRKVRLLPLLLSVSLPCMLAGFFIGQPSSWAESPALILTVSLDRESARVGDMVWLTLDYRLPIGARLPEKPVIQGTEELTITDLVKEKDRIKIRFLVDRLGTWKLGPIKLTFKDKDGKEKTMDADPVSFTVLSNLGEKPEKAGLRPIQDIIPEESKWLRILPWAAALACVFSVMAALTWWYTKRHSQDILPEVVDPPHIRAGKEIDHLEAQGLFEKGKVKTFYFTLSEILRRYMESIRHFPAAEYTTEEIVLHIRNNEEDRKILPLLRQADLVKFADSVPTQARKDEDIQSARAYIRETGFFSESANGGLVTGEDAP